MTILKFLRANWLVFQVAGEAGSGDAEAGPGGDGNPPNPAAENPPASSAGSKWWEDEKNYSADEQQWLTAKGLADEDITPHIPKLIKGWRSAEQRLGRPADQIIDRPGKDVSVSEWMRENREVFGLPEDAKGYEIKAPEDWPKDAQWDGELENEIRTIAFEESVGPGALQRFTEAYAGRVMKYLDDADQELQQANTEMRAALQKDLGNQVDAKIRVGQKALEAFAQKAGVGQDEILLAVKSLSKETGDANAMRIFIAAGEMMGDDVLGEDFASTGSSFGMTPADARAELEKMKAPDGDWYKAVGSGNRAEIERLKPQMDRLAKIATQSN